MFIIICALKVLISFHTRQHQYFPIICLIMVHIILYEIMIFNNSLVPTDYVM